MWRRLRGDRAERQAEDWLRRRGLRLVERNWSCRFGELDLVMHDDDSVVFVEVRLRTADGFGGGVASVDHHKQQRLLRAAASWLAQHPDWQAWPCRFDVVAFDGESGEPVWIRGAFEA
ncbi:MAG: YraN family protein [Wenzhouxiangellaceae bacterium]